MIDPFANNHQSMQIGELFGGFVGKGHASDGINLAILLRKIPSRGLDVAPNITIIARGLRGDVGKTKAIILLATSCHISIGRKVTAIVA